MKTVYVSPVTGAAVKYDKDWQEFVVVPKGCKLGSDECYHTDDKHDAISTANVMEAVA